MLWSLYLPIAGNATNILLLLGLGGVVGFLSGLFGVGGGFLMTPLLIMVGIPPTVAAASDSNQIVAASTSGTYAHYRMGNVDFKMGIFLLVGGLCPPNTFEGAAELRRPEHRNQDRGPGALHRFIGGGRPAARPGLR